MTRKPRRSRVAARTLWAPGAGSPDGPPDARMLAYTVGDDREWDARLLRWDILGSLGHATGDRALVDHALDRLVAVNIRGMFAAIQRAVPALGEGGRIINIGSINADRVPGPGLSVYAMTKGAVAGLTRGLARELGPRGITSVYVTPTLLETTGTRAAFPQGHFDFVLSHTPIGRFEKPEDVNGLIVFLVSDDAAFINGAAINIGGGISMH